jgi:hypothetical protein
MRLLLCLLLLALLAVSGAHASRYKSPKPIARSPPKEAAIVPTDDESTPLPRFDILGDFNIDITALKREVALSAPAQNHLPPISQIARRPGGDHECGECVRYIAAHIIKSVDAVVALQCKNTSCPIIKKRCDWIRNNQEEWTGYLVYQVRPASDGYSYCMGSGMCKHPGVNFTTNFDATDPFQLVEQLSTSADYIARDLQLDDSAEEPDDDDEPEMFGRDDGDNQHEFQGLRWTGDDEVGDPPGSKARCIKCLRKGVKWVLKRHLKHLEKECKDTKCPKIKAWCKWGKDHQKFIRGMVYAHVQPYKYAIVWCCGNKDCKKKQVQNLDFFNMGD